MRDILVTRRVPKKLPRPPRGLLEACAIGAGVLVVCALTYSFIFGPVATTDRTLRDFVVEPGQTRAAVATALADAGLIKHEAAFMVAAFFTSAGPIREGGYRVAPSMDAWTLVHTLAEAPYLAWVVVPEGKRKEETAALFAFVLGWDEEETRAYMEARSVLPDFSEGVYAAGTYLMPSDLAPELVSARLRSKFQDMAAPYIAEAVAKERSFAEVLSLASIIEREAAKNDKKLVAGILTNRLKRDMLLQADATMQYVTGNEEEGWWHAPDPDDKYVDSPFNTYQYVGVPPAPIATPSLASIEAVLNPDTTSCLYYLHDANGRIHCSPTYAGHRANVDRYLR